MSAAKTEAVRHDLDAFNRAARLAPHVPRSMDAAGRLRMATPASTIRLAARLGLELLEQRVRDQEPVE